jgi:hypothetical protein
MKSTDLPRFIARAATRLHSGSATRWRVAGAVQKDEARSLPHENIPMAVRPHDTWYVSFEPIKLPTGKRAFSRATETFRSELEAKEFARQKLAETKNVSAGTLNPHLPKRVISSAQMMEWLGEPGDTHVAP